MKKLRVCLLLFVFGFFTSIPAHAIIMRHDVPEEEYLVSDSDYPALVDLVKKGDCIGTLIHESYLLTVAHCAVDLTVGHSLNINGTAYQIGKIILHPGWQSDRDEYDIALVKLETPVHDVTPLPLFRQNTELGEILTLVGRGVHGTGLLGEPGATDDGKLRKATNMISRVDRYYLEISFEQAGESGVTRLEGVGAAGDSGCPAFIDVNGVPHLAGLNSWGDGSGNLEIGQYGARDYQTRVSRYLTWIDSQMTN